MDSTPLINRVAQSNLKTINLETMYPDKEIVYFDLKGFLFRELILKEKDFRQSLKEVDWTLYRDKIVLITCSTDAIIPMWAYMLVSTYVAEYAFDIFEGDIKEYLKAYYFHKLNALEWSQYADERVVIKGCSEKPIPAAVYTVITTKLRPYAQSIMFGEPCSTVPIYKRPRQL